jgi:putative oxidoreductase
MKDLGLLVLRMTIGGLLAGHGAQKLFGAFGGPGIDGTAGFFEQIGLRPGKLHGWAAASTEFFGGIAIALGIVTPIPAAALIAVMTAAVITVHLKNGFFASNQGFEFNLALGAALFALAGIGAGGWSLDNALNIGMTGTDWALGALVVGLLGGLGAVASGRWFSHQRERHGGHPSPA